MQNLDFVKILLTVSYIVCFIRSVSISSEQQAEREFLIMLRKTCRAVRNPKNPGHRIELSIPAAKWEMQIDGRLGEIEAAAAQVETVTG